MLIVEVVAGTEYYVHRIDILKASIDWALDDILPCVRQIEETEERVSALQD